MSSGKKIIAQTDSLFNAYYYQTISNSNDSTVNWGFGITSDLLDNLYLCGAYRGSFDADFNSGTYYLNNPFASTYINSGLISKYGISNNSLDIFYNNESNLILVYPNPFNASINIYFENKNSMQINISIKNALGQIVFCKQENDLSYNYTKTIDLSFLSKGIYLLDVTIGGDRIVKKIAKE